LLKDLFGLAISEGALVNILGDSREPFAAQASRIARTPSLVLTPRFGERPEASLIERRALETQGPRPVGLEAADQGAQ
jgi:hypothetical protein